MQTNIDFIMKRIIMMLLIAFLLSAGTARAESREWNVKKVSAFAASAILLTIDYKQTSDICAWERQWGEFTRFGVVDNYTWLYLKGKRHKEHNSIIGRGASQDRVNEYFLAVSGLLAFGTWYLDDIPALSLNGGVIIIQADAINNNIRAGIEIKF